MLKLTKEGCAARRRALIESANVDFFIITSPRHIQYFTGFYITPLALSHYGRNFLLIDARTGGEAGSSTLVAHNFLGATTDSAHVDQIEGWRWYDAATDPGIDPYPRAVEELNARLPDLRGKRVGYESGWLPYGIKNDGAEMVDVNATILKLRRAKYPDELALIREAIAVNEAGHRAGREEAKAGMSELEVQALIHRAMKLHAGHDVLLMGDFASGERIASGGPATERRIGAGELLLLDLFPIVNGYRADFTATFSVDGNPDATAIRLLAALHDALAAGESKLKPGSTGGDIHRAIKQALEPHGFADGFGHHAGHGIGLGHPEAPYFVPNSTEVVQAGDVVTLEPGSYGEGFGARIEHNYLITETGFERLSNHDTRLVTA